MTTIGTIEAGSGQPDVHRVVDAIAQAALEVAALLRHAPSQRFIAVDDDADEPESHRAAAERLFTDALRQSQVAAVSTQDELIHLNPEGNLLVTLEALDGATEAEVNAAVGTIFGILPVPAGQSPSEAILQPGSAQLAAGMILYGPGTILVLTLGAGTDAFLLDADQGGLVTTGHRLEIPLELADYTGRLTPRERAVPAPCTAPLSSAAYRIFVRGGVFVDAVEERPVHLLQQANPVALMCEQAGGRACDGLSRILDIVPDNPWQTSRLVFGSRIRVERARHELFESPTDPGLSPLFAARGLFRR